MLILFSQRSHPKACCSNKDEKMMLRVIEQRLCVIAGERLMEKGENNDVLSCSVHSISPSCPQLAVACYISIILFSK